MPAKKVIIKPLSARLEICTSAIFPMDPFVKIIVGNNSNCTSVCSKSGIKTPVWNEEIILNRDSEDVEFIVFQVWDKNKLDKQDDFVGEGKLTFSKLDAFPEGYQDWIQLKNGELGAGRLLVDVRIESDS